MTISESFIRRPIMTVLIMVSIVIFGVVAYLKLPISDLPSVDYPVMTITVYYPGASPDTMASTVAAPLESECMQIPGLQSVISTNTEGQTSITLTFDLTRNIDEAAPDVQAAISRAQANLPTDLPAQPTYSKTNPSDQPIIYLMLTSDTMPAGELYDYANRNIGQNISMIKGVAQVKIWGAKAAVRIQADPNKLAAYGIGLDEVADALRNGTVTIPGGSLDGPFRTFSIEPQGQLLRASDYAKLIVAYRNNAPVRLGDIARCVDSMENDDIRVMYGHGGKEKMQSGAVCIPVYRQAGANTVALSARVRQTLEKLKGELPGSVKLEVFYDQAVQITESVNDVKSTILIALCLVVLIIFLFLARLSDTFIPGVALPVSIIGTFIIMYAAGFSLDNLSLLGLTLSVGFLVDDAIVVLENTVRHVQAGKKPLEAAIVSMEEITGQVISISVALITVFVPIVFMGGVVGRNFKEFALTVVSAIFVSAVMALTLTPMMCARMLKPEKEKKNRFESFVNSSISRTIQGYGRLLHWVLLHKYISLLIWILCILGTLWFFVVLPKTFLPIGDSGLIWGQALVPQGTSTDQMGAFQDQVNSILQQNRSVENIITVTGMSSGADQSTGQLVATLKPREEREPIQQVTDELRAGLGRLTRGSAFIMPLPALLLSSGGEATAAGSKYSYTITGIGREEVYKYADLLLKRMKSLRGFIDLQTSVKLDMPQLKVDILRDRASTLGLTAGDIENALSYAYAGGKVTTYKTDVDQYKVILELEKEYQKIPSNLSRIYLRSRTTADLVPLGAVAAWDETIGPQAVPHSNQLNSATISFSLAPDVALGNATKALEDAVQEILPPSLGGYFQGEAQEFEEAVGSMGVLLLAAIFIMYVILGILYESYIHPFTVLTTLPPAAFGGLATLLLFRSELSLYAYIGIFMLLGIISKNGIMMVDFAKAGLEEGKSAFDAIHGACLIRFRPILMTGMSTIMGALPIALGYGADGASRRPLGLIVVGGLAFAQVITLFVTPGIFLYLQKFQEKFLDRFELTRSQHKAAESA